MKLAPVPSLEELAAEPAKAVTLTPDAARALTFRCLTVLAALATVNGAPIESAPGPAGADRLLSVEEAAHTLAVSEDWLYRRAARLPFTVRLGRVLRFSADGLERYIRQRQGRGGAA